MFFFFQSETEKRVREDIQKNMDICLQNPKKYAQAIEVLKMHINSSDQKSIQKIVDTIKATIKNQDLQPIRKYQAILLLSDLMKTNNKALGKYVVKKILKRLTILAQHKNGTKEEADEERGRDIFGDVASSQQTYSINFLNTLLTALEEWGTTWPKAPDGPYKDFHREYNELVMNGVKFPKNRPKQVSKSPPPTRNSISPAPNNSGRPSSTSKRASQIQEKPKPKSKAPVKQSKKGLSGELVRRLNDFYQKVKEPLGLFNDLLAESSGVQELPLLRDIVGQIQKFQDQGTELLIKLQGEESADTEDRKIQSYFTFLQKMEKDLNIVSKKPQKFETYKTKYLKLGKACLELISQPISNNKALSLDKSDSKLEQKSKQESQISKKQTYMSTKPPEKKDQPKIKMPNRYLSVTGVNVLGPNPNQYGSGGQNGSVERFGSFGGIQTDRHRASIPVSSPRAEKQANSDKKQSKAFASQPQVPKKQASAEIIAEQTINQPKPIEKQPIQKIAKLQAQKQKPTAKEQIKSDQNIHKSNNFFNQFAIQQKKSNNKNDITNPFKDNDSFGAFGKQTVVENDDSPDFFGNINSSEHKPNINNLNVRKKVAKQPQQVDIFAPQMKSELSEGLSAFVKNENSQLSGNRVQNKLDTNSRRSINFDNPFANAFTDKQSQKKSETNSVEKNVDSNPFSSNIFQRSGIFQNGNEEQGNKKFQTGNFGKIAQQKKPDADKDAPNPFETSSIKSKKNPFQTNNNPFQSSANPFQQDPFEKRSKNSQTSKHSQNPFDAESIHKNAPSPFQSNNLRASNPFQTSTHKSGKSDRGIDDILALFKPPSSKQLEIAQRSSNQKQERGMKKVDDKPVSSNSQQVRESIVFTVDLGNRDVEPGIEFSQFQDIAGSKAVENIFDNKPNQHQQSGFSLSQFGNMNDPFQANSLKKTQDFFAPFDFKQNQSRDSKSQYSSVKNIKVVQKVSQQPFAGFDFGQQSTNKQKRSSEKPDFMNPYDNEKTVKSHSQHSFDFSRLQKNSDILKQPAKNSNTPKEFGFQDFPVFQHKISEPKEIAKDGIVIEKKSQKELSWGDFDLSANQNKLEASLNHRQFSQNDKQEASGSNSKLLEIDSKIDEGSRKYLTSVSNLQNLNTKSTPITKLPRQPSVSLGIQDFAPVSKKGTEWNPLNMIANLRPPSFVYMIDEKKMKSKKQQLQQVRRLYEQKLQIFKLAKHKNDEIRVRLMERTSKVQEIINQKGEYMQILKKVKEDNEIKQQLVMSINQRIKRVEDIKGRILQREKKLFEITKQQMNRQERVAVQRSTSNKWQLFNKSLQMHRNSSYSMNSKFTPHAVSYY